MATKKKHRKPAAHASPPEPSPDRRASLPVVRLPRPDLTLWMVAGMVGVLVVALLRALVQRAVRLDRPDAFWQAAEAGHWAGAAAVANPVAVAAGLWAALAVGVAVVWLAAWQSKTEQARPWMAGLGLAAACRLGSPALAVVLVVVGYGRGLPYRPRGVEEFGLEVLTGWPMAFLLVVEIVAMAPAVRTLWAASGFAAERLRMIALAAGLCFGFGVLLVAA